MYRAVEPVVPRSRVAIGLVGTIALLVAFTGCSAVRLPAIDPSGDSIFLPTSTRLAPPPPNLPLCPTPAFSTPDEPPPCSELPQAVQPAPVPKVRNSLCNTPAYLELSPAKIVSAVGREIILTAGLRDTSGAYITRQPIEWLMSPDSVGHFVEVGEDGRCCKHHFFDRNPPRKLTGDYAVSRTSSKAYVVTRGTPQPDDDAAIRPGQTFISLTSPSEGTSYVTVFAPEVPNWTQRRLTATVYWVDFKRQFPGPVNARVGQTVRLVTRVTRSNDEAAEEGHWIVRYEVLGVARRPEEKEPEIPTDRDGNAAMDVNQYLPQAGVTRVKIQIVQPARNNVPRLILDEGETTISWSAPGLSVNVRGPSDVPVGSTVNYFVEVSNPGNLPTQDITVSLRRPAGMELLGSSPQHQEFGDRLQWTIPALPPRAAQQIAINFRADREANLEIPVEATAPGNLQATAAVRTRVFVPALKIAVTGPTTAQAGESITYRIRIDNIGSEELRNAVVRLQFDPRLEHRDANGQIHLSPIERQVQVEGVPSGLLPATSFAEIRVTFRVRQTGPNLCFLAEAFADGGHAARAQVCLEEPPLEPRMAITKTGPIDARVGDVVRYEIRVQNTGTATLTGIRVVDVMTRSLAPVAATPGHRREGDAIVWDSLPQTPPQQQFSLYIDCRAVEADAQAANSITVTCAQGLSETREWKTRIQPALTPPVLAPPTPPTAPNRPAEAPPAEPEGKLVAQLADLRDPARVGDTVDYLLTIQNQRTVEDANVRVMFVLPEQMQFQALTGPAAGPTELRRSEGRTIEIEPIRALRPGDTVRLRLSLKCVVPGTARVIAQIGSQRATGFEISETTRINP